VGPRLCLAVAWAAWTIKPTLNRNDEGPEEIPGFFSCAEATAGYLSRHLPANSLLYGSGCRAAGPRLDEIVAALRKWRIAGGAARSGNSLPDTTSALKSLRVAEQDRAVTVLLRLSFLLLFRENRVPVILISFRNRFLALAPTIN